MAGAAPPPASSSDALDMVLAGMRYLNAWRMRPARRRGHIGTLMPRLTSQALAGHDVA
jgi:hypothetical protein